MIMRPGTSAIVALVSWGMCFSAPDVAASDFLLWVNVGGFDSCVSQLELDSAEDPEAVYCGDGDFNGIEAAPNGDVYWMQTDGRTTTLRRGLTEAVAVATVSGYRRRFALDTTRGVAYIGGAEVTRVDLASGSVDVALEHEAASVAVDEATGTIFVTTFSNDIVSFAAGSETPVLLASVVSTETVGLAVDSDAGKLYWVRAAQDLIVDRSNLDGSDVEEVVRVDKFLDDWPSFIDVVPERDAIYFANGEDGEIHRSGRNGGAVETLASVRGLTGIEFLAGASEGPEFIRGDANQDGVLHIADAVLTFVAIFRPVGPGPQCWKATDSNDDGTVDVSDGVYTLKYLFGGGNPPPPPFPECGSDPTPEGLGCDAYRGC